MHIAHLIDTLEIGGAQKLLVLFAGEAKARGVQVTVISLTTRDSNPVIVADLESFGVKVIMLSIHKLYDPTAIPTLIKVLRREKVEVLQTHLRHSNILGILAGMLAGAPVIGTLHSTHAQPTGRLYRLRFLAEQYLLRFCASRVIAVGRMIEEVNRNRLVEKKMDIVPNPVSPLPFISQEERKQIRQGIAVDSNRFLILTVGRLQPEKGLQDLFIAFSRVLKKHSSAILIIVGSGEILDELQLQSASLGLDGNVQFLGSRNDVPKLMMAGDVYVSSSYREGLSLAMLEAMSAGMPILATKVGDTEFLLNEGRGLIVEPRDSTALADGMCYLIENPEKMIEMGRAAREFVKLNYSPSPWMDRLLGIYGQVSN
jgi:glycosyltransferase involved in cell wall biosynthesis